jgi:hypothetical protein
LANINPESLFIQRRLGGVVRQLNGIVMNLEEFRDEHPTIIAPNMLDTIIHNLKDDINVLLREVNILGSPNPKALQERRYVCRSCNSVFSTPIVAGVCDECRGRGVTSAEFTPMPVAGPEASAEAGDDVGEAGSETPGAVTEASAEPEDILPTPTDDEPGDPFATP